MRALKPWMDRIPPNALSADPAEVAALEELQDYMGSLDPEVRELLEKFFACSAAEILDSTLKAIW